MKYLRVCVDDHDQLAAPCELCGLSVPARAWHDHSAAGPRVRLCPGCVSILGNDAPIREACELVARSIQAIAKRLPAENPKGTLRDPQRGKALA